MEFFRALLNLKSELSNDDAIARWGKQGQKALTKKQHITGSPLVISFAPPPQEILKKMRARKFKWNRFRNEWYGIGDKEELENILEHLPQKSSPSLRKKKSKQAS